MEGPGDGVPWTTAQIREHASNWTLQGDSKLLLHLQKFSENLEERSKKTKKNLDDMMSQLDSTQIALGNATNRFLALQHSQFVESRVYEEDIEALVQNKTVEPPKMEPKVDPVAVAKEAVLLGLDLLETHFEPITISQDVGDGVNRFVLRPKDMYVDRPLPCLIGSSEFFKFDNPPSETESEGGLIDSSRSDSVSIASSQSLSQSPHTANTIGPPSWRSDSLQYNIGTPNSAERDVPAKPHGDLFGDGSEEEEEEEAEIFSGSSKLFDTRSNDKSAPHQESVPKISKLLATTESGLFSDEDDLFSNITAAKPKPRDNYSMLFNDGPPLLDDLFDDYKKPRKQKDSLFDDDEHDDDFKVPSRTATKGAVGGIFKEPQKPRIVNLFDDIPPDDFANLASTSSPKDDDHVLPGGGRPPTNNRIDDVIKPTASRPARNSRIDDLTNEIKKKSSLFSDDDDDVDFLQPKVNKKENINDFTREGKRKISMFDDDDVIKPTSNKPVKNAAVDNLAQEIKRKTIIFDDDDEDDDFLQSLATKSGADDKVGSVRSETKRNNDVVDDVMKSAPPNPLAKDKLAPLDKGSRRTTNMFDDDDDDFVKSMNDKRKSSIFDDLDDVDFVKPQENIKNNKVISKKEAILFGDDGDLFNDSKKPVVVNAVKTEPVKTKTKAASLFDDEPPTDFEFPASKRNTGKKKISLFDDDDDDDDLFGDLIKNKSKSKNDADLFSTKPPPTPTKTVSLFSDDSNDVASSRSEARGKGGPPEGEIRPVNLFKDSPPELDLINKEISPPTTTSEKEGKGKKSFGLFDDDDDFSFNDNPPEIDFTIKEDVESLKGPSNAPPVSLFDDGPPEIDVVSETDASESLFSQRAEHQVSKSSNISIFDDEPPPSDMFESNDVTDDLDNVITSQTSSQSTAATPRVTLYDNEPPLDLDFDYKLTRNRSLFNDSDDDLFTSRFRDDLQKVDDDVDVEVASPEKTNETSKHLIKNLNINICALLPGSKPPKKDVLAAFSPPTDNSVSDIDKLKVRHSENDILSDSSENTASEQTLSSDHVTAGSGEQPEITSPSHTTLHNSVIKERAKIKVKRRPSSRKARQESIRKSLIHDDSSLPGEDSSPALGNNKNKDINGMATSKKIENKNEPGELTNQPSMSEDNLSNVRSSTANNISVHDLDLDLDLERGRRENGSLFDEDNLFEDPLLNKALFTSSRNVTHSEGKAKVDENLSKMSIVAHDGSAEDIFNDYKTKPDPNPLLFDDDDHLFMKTDKKLNKTIMEEENDELLEDDLNIFNKNTKKVKKNDHLFSDDDDDDLFNAKKPKNKVEGHPKDTMDNELGKGVFSQSARVVKKAPPSKAVTTKATPLFGDSDDDDNDLFRTSRKSSK